MKTNYRSISRTALDDYLQAIGELQTRVLVGQRPRLLETAARMADTTRNDRRIFLFGTGHSHLLAEEGFYRAGGVANVVPILTEHTMLHHLPELGSRLERTSGLADLILDRYDPQPEEMLFVFSNSGVNQLPVEMALCGRERGLFVVGISSFEYARQAPVAGAQGPGTASGVAAADAAKTADAIHAAWKTVESGTKGQATGSFVERWVLARFLPGLYGTAAGAVAAKPAFWRSVGAKALRDAATAIQNGDDAVAFRIMNSAINDYQGANEPKQ